MKETEEFKQSIHGKALLAGIPDAPTCTDCHGEHDIEGPDTKDSAVSARLVSKETCPRCHDDVRTMTKYGVETMHQASYMDSYHGMASDAGSVAVASCSSCHGTHNILPHDDPNSTVFQANLPHTCGQCHEDAGPNFAAGPVHIMPTDPGQKALGIVRVIYLWLIAVTLGGMILHNSLLLCRHMLTKFFEEWKGRRTYKRFSKGQVIGHLILSISFTVLGISGFALRYPEQWWSRMLFFGDTGLEIRANVHRIAAVVFIGITLLNLFYSLFTRYGRKEMYATVLGFKDLKDLLLNLGFALGLTRKRPKYDRYTYSEKLEYWGLWWGTWIMIITGLCMWYVDVFLTYLPKVMLDIAALIHWYEAWLAIGTILIWHMYYMIIDPESYPMNWSWITGKITEHDFKEHHPLEFERVAGQESSADEEDPERTAEEVDPITPALK
ncbi:MAG: cytochrome b/b6 domain-containing protein [Candidatus Hydrogenedentes bacterium]|nr:cytochrome b/b6 domain-containing protein [Candidatus Hydrogenedentota bacterium]